MVSINCRGAVSRSAMPVIARQGLAASALQGRLFKTTVGGHPAYGGNIIAQAPGEAPVALRFAAPPALVSRHGFLRLLAAPRPWFGCVRRLKRVSGRPASLFSASPQCTMPGEHRGQGIRWPFSRTW